MQAFSVSKVSTMQGATSWRPVWGSGRKDYQNINFRKRCWPDRVLLILKSVSAVYFKHIGDKTSRKTSSTLQHRSICLNTTNWLKICANLSMSNGKSGLYLVLAHHVYPSTRISPDVTDPFQSYPQQVVLLCLNGHILSQFILHHSYIVRLSLPINFMTTCIS